MLKSETANSKGLCSETLLRDMTKFYEGISLERLELHCQRFQFPPVLHRLSIAAHRGARFMCMGNYVPGPFYAVRGVIAGCSFATSYVKVYCIESFDQIEFPPPHAARPIY
eukprot:259824-Pyramimonas_sp.AAC.1